MGRGKETVCVVAFVGHVAVAAATRSLMRFLHHTRFNANEMAPAADTVYCGGWNGGTKM